MPRYNTVGNDPLRTVTKDPKPQTWQSDETLFEVCEKLWEYLAANSYEDAPGVVRWQGAISNWFREAKRTNLYSPIMYLMREMGSCYIETKGSRWAGTVVRLVQPPTLEALKGVRRDHFFFEKPAINKRDEREMLIQAIDDLRRQVTELTNRVDRLENHYNKEHTTYG